jgi:hypothetical protein
MSDKAEGKITSVTEAKGVPLEKAAGRSPVGSPPAKVNPAPQTSNSPGTQSQAAPAPKAGSTTE